MVARFLLAGLACVLGTQSIAQEPPDIVGEAAAAILARDAEALKSAQFDARDFDSKLISVDTFLAKLEGCEVVANYKRGMISNAHEIHYDCPVKHRQPVECWSDLAVVKVDRASSPHVTAHLRDKRMETWDCRCPDAPVPPTP